MNSKTKENSYLIDWLSFTIQTDIHGVGKKAVREFLEQMDLDTLPFAENNLENIVSTWTLCSIAELEQSMQEIYRVLQPGGTLHVVEHVLNRQNLNIQRLQHLLTPIQKKVADGCHLNRDIETALLETGFEIETLNYIDAEGIPKIGQRMLLARVRKP